MTILQVIVYIEQDSKAQQVPLTTALHDAIIICLMFEMDSVLTRSTVLWFITVT